jgi:hypothetical protein
VEGELLFPIVFIYPEFGQFDYVEKMEAEETVWGAFYEIFDSGLPWDEKKFYLEKKNIVFALRVQVTHTAQPDCIGHEET